MAAAHRGDHDLSLGLSRWRWRASSATSWRAGSGHLLVIPERHAPCLEALDPAECAVMFTVFHTRLHVLPRTPGDGVVLSADFEHPSRQTRDRRAAAIVAALEQPDRSAADGDGTGR